MLQEFLEGTRRADAKSVVESSVSVVVHRIYISAAKKKRSYVLVGIKSRPKHQLSLTAVHCFGWLVVEMYTPLGCGYRLA